MPKGLVSCYNNMDYARKATTMGFMDKLLGNTSEAKLKKLAPLVKKINDLEPEMHALSDAELRAKTDEFKSRLANGEKETIYCTKRSPL